MLLPVQAAERSGLSVMGPLCKSMLSEGMAGGFRQVIAAQSRQARPHTPNPNRTRSEPAQMLPFLWVPYPHPSQLGSPLEKGVLTGTDYIGLEVLDRGTEWLLTTVHYREQ